VHKGSARNIVRRKKNISGCAGRAVILRAQHEFIEVVIRQPNRGTSSGNQRNGIGIERGACRIGIGGLLGCRSRLVGIEVAGRKGLAVVVEELDGSDSAKW